MFEKKLKGRKIAVLAADGFEQIEVTGPLKRLRKQGADVEVISLHDGKIRGINFLYPGKKIRVDRTIDATRPNHYDALFIPGGFINPDLLRQSEAVRDFVRDFDRSGKPIAMICHGPWVASSAGVVKGRTLTSWPGIQDDLRNAGGTWIDEPIVVDGNWLSSRGPQDLPRFERALVKHFAGELELEEVRSPRMRVLKWVAAGAAIVAAAAGLRQATPGRSRWSLSRGRFARSPTRRLLGGGRSGRGLWQASTRRAGREGLAGVFG